MTGIPDPEGVILVVTIASTQVGGVRSTIPEVFFGHQPLLGGIRSSAKGSLQLFPELMVMFHGDLPLIRT